MTGPFFLTGSNGQVGGALEPMLRMLGHVRAPRREELDLSDSGAVRRAIQEIKPRWIVNAAAYTAVDKAETDKDAAYRLNDDLPRILGEEAAALGSIVIHFSTDYVFAGTGSKPYIETDPTGPLNVYGASKLAGEQSLAATGAAHFIFRTSWVYGAVGKNFLTTILQLAREREKLKIVDDQHGAPTWSKDLARLAMHTIQRCEASGHAASTAHHEGGIFHACCSGGTTWFGFAEEFLRIAAARRPGKWAALQPIPSMAYPTPAKRPTNSRMDCSRLARVLEFRMPDLHESLANVMDRIEL